MASYRNPADLTDAVQSSETTSLLIRTSLPENSGYNIDQNGYEPTSGEAQYYSQKPSLFKSLLPFIYGTIFGTSLWPILITLLTYSMLYKSNPQIQSNFKPSYQNNNNQTQNVVVKSKGIKFDDIAGLSEAKAELAEIVHYIRNPEPYEKLGARLPKGVLLAGPPGSGKTMLANAVATEAGIPYLYVSGSEFVEIFVGQGAKRVRNLFLAARKLSPCIIFIDELDAVGGRRSSGSPLGGGHREHDQTLNQLLVELDGFNSPSGIIVLAATNRIDSLDSALLRPGRFDRIVQIGLPDIEGRKAILNMYLTHVPIKVPKESITSLAKMTSGFSGADLENLVNEAALLSARSSKPWISEKELNEARDKVAMGPERRSLVIPEKQKTLTAYHEAGHALVAYYLHPDTDPINKITIISRGNALGFVELIPPEDRYGFARSQLEAKLAVIMGGRAAERIVFGKDQITSGASSDIQTATNIANKMVCEWGMSEKVGPMNCKNYQNSYVTGSNPTFSSKTSNLIENEIKALISKAQTKAENILYKHRWELDLIAQTLLEKETLTGTEFEELLNSKKSYLPFPYYFFHADDTLGKDSNSKSTTDSSSI